MLTNRQLQTLVGLVLAALIIVLLLQGKNASFSDFYHASSYVVTVVSVALILWERFLWRCWPFNPLLTTRPNLKGTWKGELLSTYEDPATGQGRGAIEVYIVVRQTYSVIDVRLFSAESSSISLSGSFTADSAGLYTLASVYRNTPAMLQRDHSVGGNGGLLLYVRGRPIHQLDGEYWTERKTSGQMLFKKRSNKEAHDFGQAQGFTYKSISG